MDFGRNPPGENGTCRRTVQQQRISPALPAEASFGWTMQQQSPFCRFSIPLITVAAHPIFIQRIRLMEFHTILRSVGILSFTVIPYHV